MIVHEHAVIVASVRRPSDEITCADLQTLLRDLVESIGMQPLFDPIAIHGKYGYTGIVGIVTSHIAFHYFDADRALHFDVYSCKSYDLLTVLHRLDAYWGLIETRIVFINRDHGPMVEYYSYREGALAPGFPS